MSKAFIQKISLPFNPTRIGGCQLWLDGVDPAGTGTAPTNGSTVSTWVDKALGKNASATGTPTYVSGGGINFNGTSYFLNQTFSQDLSQRSIFIIMQETTHLDYAGVFPLIPNPSNDADVNTGLSIETYNGIRFINLVSAGYTSELGTNPLTKAIYNDNMNGLTGSGYKNGTNITNATAARAFGTSSGYGLGARYYPSNMNTTYGLNGIIHEIIFFNRPLNITERQQVEGYLAQKWGLTANLPPGHPGLTQTIYTSGYNAKNPGIATTPSFAMTNLPYTNYYALSISRCALWLDAADPAGTGIAPANGSIISTWIDKSGTGNNGTSYGNPTFVTSAFNGKPSILFNGSTQYFVGAITNTGNTVSVFAIVSMNSGSQYGRICSLAVTNNFDGGVSSAYFIPLIRSSTNQSIQSGRYQGSGNVNVGPVAITYNVPFQAASIVDGTTNTLYLNGTSSASGSSTGNFGYTAYGIGAQPSNFQPEYFQGYISEIIIYNTALTTTQRQQIEGYLAWKWGLQSSLINTNPYYTAAPLSFGRPSQVAGIPVQVKMSAIRVVQLQYSGTYTTAGNFFATFTGNGSVTVLSPVTINYFAIGGGGGGGAGPGGGGGAGGLQMGSMSLSVGTYNIVIGPGGPAHTNGSNTTFGTTLVVALGGGFGADGYPSTETGGSGGCGGGRGSGVAGAPGTGSQGYNGGSMGGIGSGGGGGVGGVGETSPTTFNTGGAGGIGVLYYGTYYGGGGGGAPNHGGGTGFAGAGGLGGGGRGGQNGLPILDTVDGTPNTGGGGGGGRSANQYSGPGAAGGSGVFIFFKYHLALEDDLCFGEANKRRVQLEVRLQNPRQVPKLIDKLERG